MTRTRSRNPGGGVGVWRGGVCNECAQCAPPPFLHPNDTGGGANEKHEAGTHLRGARHCLAVPPWGQGGGQGGGEEVIYFQVETRHASERRRRRRVAIVRSAKEAAISGVCARWLRTRALLNVVPAPGLRDRTHPSDGRRLFRLLRLRRARQRFSTVRRETDDRN